MKEELAQAEERAREVEDHASVGHLVSHVLPNAGHWVHVRLWLPPISSRTCCLMLRTGCT